MEKEWIYKQPDPGKVLEISTALGVSPTLAALLVNRNISNRQDAEGFLYPDLSRMHNPFLLPDMEKAALRTRQAVDNNERILIYGDRDVDGVTSTALLVRALKGLGADVTWTVASGERYGLDKAVLDKYKKEGVKLVITVDCGTQAHEEIEHANALGMEVIVTDHHLPGPTLPPAYAVVNPNLHGSTYPMKELAGCVAAFKFAYAVMFTYNRVFNQDYIVLDLETTGLNYPPHEIVEIGAVRVRNFVPVKYFHTLIRPTISIPEGATRVHGITNDMVERAPTIWEALPQLIDFIGHRTIVAHNAKFDMTFLKEAVWKQLGKSFENPYIDTLSLSRASFPFRSHALTSLVKEFNINVTQSHRALDDCLATAEVYKRVEEANDPRLGFFIQEHLDLVTLGAIADVVPLLDENRLIVNRGLARLFETRKVGLRKLLEACGIKSKSPNGEAVQALCPSAREISFSLTPVLNAAGRFLKADLAVMLLISESERESGALVREMMLLNQDRKLLQKSNSEHFSSLVEAQCDLVNDKIIFVVASGLDHGVTGIVANVMLRKFDRPAVLLITRDGLATGSCRSIPGFNIVNALAECKEFLDRFGGHAAAAGLTLKAENIPALREKLKAVAAREMSGALKVSPIEIDRELSIESINYDLLAQISMLEPFGQDNPPPIFAVKKFRVKNLSQIGKTKDHLHLSLSGEDGATLHAVGWRMGSAVKELAKEVYIDAVFHLEPDRRRGESAFQLNLIDIQRRSYGEN